MNHTTNQVQEAVEYVGGPTRVANLLRVSNSTVHSWMNKGRIPSYDKAEALAALAKVTVQRLRGDR